MHFDLVVVGTGSGNTIMGREYQDLNIAIVEADRFGGTCLNVGCIPTKMYVYPADIADNARRAGPLGVHATIDSIDWPGMRDRIFGAGSPGTSRWRLPSRTAEPLNLPPTDSCWPPAAAQ